MTVQEVMAAMIGAYRGFDSSAVAAMAGVFQQKLERYEGKELANAWIEVASSFDAKPSKPYPLPKDFEEVLPQRVRMPQGSPAAALDLKGHGERRAKLVAEWRQGQGVEIAKAWGARVGFACDGEVRRRADLLAWRDDVESIELGQADVDKLCDSLVSQDRVGTFGAGLMGRTDSYDEWKRQMDHCRGHVLAGRFSFDETPQEVRQARPKRSGVVLDVRPDEFVEVGEPPLWLDDGAPPPSDVIEDNG